MKSLINRFLVLFCVLILCYFTAIYFGFLYVYLFPNQLSGGWIGGYGSWEFIMGLPLSYIFFITVFFSIFGEQHKYWWIGILLIPAFAFEIYFDLGHVYFPIALGVLGWLVGQGILKLMGKRRETV